MPCEWTEEFLSRNGILYTRKDVRADPGARAELIGLGFRSTPVTLVDGVPVVGFEQNRLIALLTPNE
jgi:hypothetical protein